MKFPAEPARQPASRLPHLAARLMVCATFPLIFVGGLVTTYQAGMAVPDWPSTYGYNLFLYPWATWWSGPFDLFVEHGHRLLGATVGLLALLTAGLVWRYDSRRSARSLSLLAVALVIFQGGLGGARVLLDDYLLARIHGCTAPLFFALATALCVILSPAWRKRSSDAPSAWSIQLAVLAPALAGLIYGQIVLGACLRHATPWSLPQTIQAFVWFHLLMAAATTLGACLLLANVWRQPGRTPWESRPALWLPVLFVAQIGLGSATWIVQFGYPDFLKGLPGAESYVVQAESLLQSIVTTAHVAMGSLLLAVSVTAAMRVCRAVYLAQGGLLRPAPRVAHRGEVPA